MLGNLFQDPIDAVHAEGIEFAKWLRIQFAALQEAAEVWKPAPMPDGWKDWSPMRRVP